jgi:hypothetical protein
MSYGRFHTICDCCGSRSEEYGVHTIPCRAECGRDVCEPCADVYDPDPPGYAICKECAKEAA